MQHVIKPNRSLEHSQWMSPSTLSACLFGTTPGLKKTNTTATRNQKAILTCLDNLTGFVNLAFSSQVRSEMVSHLAFSHFFFTQRTPKTGYGPWRQRNERSINCHVQTDRHPTILSSPTGSTQFDSMQPASPIPEQSRKDWSCRRGES